MPIISDAATALKSRFGFHQSSSEPDLVRSSPAVPKSASKDALFLSSSTSSSVDGDRDGLVENEKSSSQSFDFQDDPSFWKDHNVQVIIRVRPLSDSEISLQGYNKCVKQDGCQTITWTGHPESRFTFDLVADENVTQEKLFKVAGLPMVENCMEGYNSCMFAYGQEKEARRDDKLLFICKCSFLEIYNEQILDLLDPSSANLQIREDSKKGVYVENLRELEVSSARDVMLQLIQGAANRKVASTNMNRASSRSHSVFTCIIESKWESQGVTHHRFARLNLVDLAGSERQKSSGAEGSFNEYLVYVAISGHCISIVFTVAVVNEDASGDVLAMRTQIQQLKKEVSRLRGMVNEGAEDQENDNLSICESPGSFKWEGLQGSFSPLISDKKLSQKKDYEAALVAAFRRETDKEIALQALTAENQAAMHLVKQREDEIQGLKMRLRFREAGIKRLESVASGKISAEVHLLQEKEEHLKEIDVLRNQVDRNQEVTRFAMENLRLKEELRRLKSFYVEGEREMMNEQIKILQNKLLEALDWKLMNESDPGLVQEPRSPCRTYIKEENEFLHLQAIQNQKEMETLHRKLNASLEEKEKLERSCISDITLLGHAFLISVYWKLTHEKLRNIPEANKISEEVGKCIEGLASELEEEKRSNKNINEQAMQQIQVESPLSSRRPDHPSDANFNDQMELKTMVDAIAAASQREAEAHEKAIMLSKENDELRMKLKVLIEDNNKLIELYEGAVAETKRFRECQGARALDESEDKTDQMVDSVDVHEESDVDRSRKIESLEHQLQEMQEENEKLMGLCEQAMQDRDGEEKTNQLVDSVDVHEGSDVDRSRKIESLEHQLQEMQEENEKLMGLYEQAMQERDGFKSEEKTNQLVDSVDVHEESDVDRSRKIESLEHQLQEMHEENEKLMGLYEKAMQERDGFKMMLDLNRLDNVGEMKNEFDCPEKLVEVDEVENFECNEFASESDDVNAYSDAIGFSGLTEQDGFGACAEDIFKDGTDRNLHEEVVSIGEISHLETRPSKLLGGVSEELILVRDKLENAQAKIASAAKALTLLGLLESTAIEMEMLSKEIEEAEKGVLVKQQEIVGLKCCSSDTLNRKSIVSNKLSALKSSVSRFSSSISYWEQREARAKARMEDNSSLVEQKKQVLVDLCTQMEETELAQRNAQESEVQLKNHISSLKSKLEDEIQRKESEKVLFAIENLNISDAPAHKNWQSGGKATELLKSEENRTKLQREIKQCQENLGVILREIDVSRRKSTKLETEKQAVERDISSCLRTAKELELGFQQVKQEKETIVEMAEKGKDELGSLMIEYHQCVSIRN
ncbi:hypothetical protein Scep_013850 [Stephania cephalantha]|uniref:Kinesin motor domain-containing protein n=1 Tax=Stephania cephalantha TaxID=152367 RepID=A0AAP0P030_9MAGN